VKGCYVDLYRVQGSAFVPGRPVQGLFVTCSRRVPLGLASLLGGALRAVGGPGRWVAGELAQGRGERGGMRGGDPCSRPVGDLLAS
jgi:hypothetical protein